MKGTRQSEILRIIREHPIETQEQLLQELKKPELRVQSFTTLPSLIVGKSTREICPVSS